MAPVRPKGEYAAAAAAAALRRKQQHFDDVTEGYTVSIKELFNKLDVDGDKEITKDEAISHWGKNFAKLNAAAMFNEVDVDKDKSALENFQNLIEQAWKVVKLGFSPKTLTSTNMVDQSERKME